MTILGALDLNGRAQTKDRSRPALPHLDLVREPAFRYHDLPIGLLSEVASYVPHAACVSTSFKEADFAVYKQSLSEEIPQLPVMKKAFQYLYPKEFYPKGPPEGTEKQVILKTKREVGSLIQKGMSILPKEEQAELLLDGREPRLWSLQRLENAAQKIARQRRENLVQFFETLIEGRWIEPEALERAESLKNEIAELPIERKVQRIRTWLRRERPFLDPRLGEDLELAEIFLKDSCSSATREIFFLRGMRRFSAQLVEQMQIFEGEEVVVTQLDIPLAISALHNRAEILEEVLQDPDFANVDRRVIGDAFSEAASRGHLSVLRTLLTSSRGAEISAEQLKYIFNTACRDGHLAIAEYLLSCGAVEITAHDLAIALRAACIEGHFKVVKFLLRHDLAHEILDESNNFLLKQALGLACEDGHFEMVKFLLEDRRTAEILKNDMGKYLCGACKGGHLAVVEYLLSCDQVSKILTCHLYWALQHLYERVPEAEYLFNENQVNEVSTDKLRWVFLGACFGNQIEVVQEILNGGRSAEIASEDLKAGLVGAASKGHLAGVKFLLENNRSAEISAEDLGKSLKEAANKGHLAVVEFLLENNRSAEISKQDLEEAFTAACLENHLAILRYLLDCNRSGEISSEFLEMNFFDFLRINRLEVVEFLLNCDRDIGPSAQFYIAVHLGDLVVMESLCRSGEIPADDIGSARLLAYDDEMEEMLNRALREQHEREVADIMIRQARIQEAEAPSLAEQRRFWYFLASIYMAAVGLFYLGRNSETSEET